MYNLLVVDDRDVFHRTITRMPYFIYNQDKFCITALAKNGLEALEILKKGDTDIVLTDIRMPLMSGIDLLKEIHKSNLCNCTILLSEYSDFFYAKEGIINGAFDYIVKPLDNDKIKTTFDRAYEYLQEFVDKGSYFPDHLIRKFMNSLLFDEEMLFLLKLDRIMEHVKRNSKSFMEMLLVVNSILEKINSQIMYQFKFVVYYIPLEKICSINHRTQTEKELIELLKSKAILIRNELEKFKQITSNRLVNEIKYYIISNIEDICTLQSVAEKFYINKKYLSTLFKKETGMYYMDFITLFKIERAKMLLSYSDLKIWNIAEILGFSDAEYFSKVFKKRTGFTPSAFHWNHFI